MTLSDNRSVPGLDTAALTAWLSVEVPSLAPPLSFTFISGGRSNLTFRIDDAAGRSAVLRRPPLGHVLQTAHDMSREWRAISALAPTPVPVPTPLAFCADPSVTGAEFYVMGHVAGHVVADAADAEVLSTAARANAGEDLARVLAALHAIDPDAVGLTGFGRRKGYIARQLRRWKTQVEQSRTRPLPAVDELHAELSRDIPAEQRTGIVHGDFRLGNMIVDGAGRIQAVLDWELSTLGDPLADIGWLLSSWAEPGEDAAAAPSPSVAPGFPSRAGLLRAYAEHSRLNVSGIEFYVAFARWRGLCISEGVYARYRAGVMGDDGFDISGFGDQILARSEFALESYRAARRGERSVVDRW